MRGILTAAALILLGIGAVITAGVLSDRPSTDPVVEAPEQAPAAEPVAEAVAVAPAQTRLEIIVSAGGLNLDEAVQLPVGPPAPPLVVEPEPAVADAPAPVAAPAPATPAAAPAPAAPAAQVAVAEPVIPVPNAQAVAEIAPPEFDIVRVNPAGGAVIAGRGPPGADIIINAGNEILAETRADGFGEWVVVPDRPLPPGPQDLGIQARLPDDRVIRSEQVVTLLVPGPEAPAEERAVAVLQDREGGAPPRIMQSPITAPPGQVGELTLDAVQYDEAGNLVLSGKARMGGEVRVFVDGQPIGLAEADVAGAWQIAPDAAVDIGRHDLRLEQINAEGQVVAEIALPFMRASPAETQGLGPGEMIVQPGASLWRIARSTYGQGVLYTVIYLANANQIDDPDLIYPGQIFTLPTAQ